MDHRIFCTTCKCSHAASRLFGPHPLSWLRLVYRWWSICRACGTAYATMPPAATPARRTERRLARAGQGALFS